MTHGNCHGPQSQLDKWQGSGVESFRPQRGPDLGPCFNVRTQGVSEEGEEGEAKMGFSLFFCEFFERCRPHFFPTTTHGSCHVPKNRLDKWQGGRKGAGLVMPLQCLNLGPCFNQSTQIASEEGENCRAKMAFFALFEFWGS